MSVTFPLAFGAFKVQTTTTTQLASQVVLLEQTSFNCLSLNATQTQTIATNFTLLFANSKKLCLFSYQLAKL